MSKERICDICEEVINNKNRTGVFKPNLVWKTFSWFGRMERWSKHDLCAKCNKNLKRKLKEMKNEDS